MSDAQTTISDQGAEGTATAAAGGELAGGRAASLWSDAWRDLRRRVTFWIPVLILLFMLVMAVFPQLFTSTGPNGDCVLAHAKQRPSSWNPFVAGAHPFGYDISGCDYFAQVVHGARAPIVIGVVVTAAALAVAVLLGSLAGYYGGWLDMLIARVTDIFFGLPFVLGAVVIFTAFPNHGIWAMSLVLIVLGWTTMTRVMRGQVIAAKGQDYVQAARMLGAGDLRIMTRHILPNAIAPVFVLAMLNVGTVIAGEATLDFLGVGLQYPQVSWGLQLNVAQSYFLDHPYLLVYPAVFLTFTVLSFLMLGDVVRDALDPKLR